MAVIHWYSTIKRRIGEKVLVKMYPDGEEFVGKVVKDYATDPRYVTRGGQPSARGYYDVELLEDGRGD